MASPTMTHPARESDIRPRRPRRVPLVAGALLVLTAGAARADDWTNMGLDPFRSRVSSERSGAPFDAGAWQHQWTTTEQPSYRAVLTTPAVGDSRIAFATQRNVVRVLDAVDGSLIWEAKAGGAVFSSPTIWQGLVFVYGVNQQLYAFRLADGAIVWQKSLEAMGYSSLVIIDGNLFVASGIPTPQLWSIDAATGSTRWQAGDGILNASALASVAVAQGHVLVGELDGHYHSFALADGKWQWTANTGGRVALSSPLVVGTRVYFLPGGDSARLHAVDLGTGVELDGWPLDLPMPDPDATLGTPQERTFVASSPAGNAEGLAFAMRADDRITSTADGSNTYLSQEVLFAVDGANRKVLWSKANGRLASQDPNDTPNYEFLPTPALYHSASNELLIAAASTLSPSLRVFSINGDERWTTTLSAATRSSPVLANGRLVVATDAGIVHSFLSGTNRPPLAPTQGFSPTAGASSDAAGTTLRWGAASDPESQPLQYIVRVDDDGEIQRDWDLEMTTSAGQLSLDLPPLVVGKVYTFAVRARDSQGALAPWSAAQTFTATVSPAVTVDDKPAADLRDALSSAHAGSTVRLAMGQYDLSEPLPIPAGVSLIGAGPHLTILNGKGLDAAVVPGAGSSLGRLTVTGGHVGLSITASDVHLRNLVLRDNDDAGLDVTASGTAELVNATVVRNGTGVRAAGTTRVRNALVTNNGVGLQAASAGLLTSGYDNVYQNHVEDYRNVDHATSDLALAVDFESTDANDLRLKAAQPTTDHGDPADDFSLEPAPNGGRINIGAFGNTEFAELSATSGIEPSADGGVGANDGGIEGGSAPDGATDGPAAPDTRGGGCSCDLGADRSSAAPGLMVALGLMLGYRRARRRR